MIEKQQLKALLNECAKKFKTEDDIEEIILYLRQNSCSIIECIGAIRDIRKIPLDEAKKIVHFSKTWSDLRDNHNKFHEDLWKAVKILAKTDKTITIIEDGVIEPEKNER